MEVFDTKIRTWEFMPSLGSESFDYENMALEGSIYVRSNEKGETFKLNKNDHYRLADYGGNLVFLWEELVHILRMFKTKR
uniref:Uncharacterized protein n=1 Tax=Brassica campestris TaxID=3711 RepID=A0A3P6AIK7_BRACM|nr:unnamed protein product [Brassica rapa]